MIDHFTKKDFLKIVSSLGLHFTLGNLNGLARVESQKYGQDNFEGSSWLLEWSFVPGLMIKHKIKHDPKYDYEEEHKNKALVVINNLKESGAINVY